MNLQQLRTLVAIQDHARFSDAAEAVYLTPAAVSQQMRALEETLKVSLFDRSTRPPRLNAHGVDLVREARDLLARFDTLAARARSPGEIAGMLTIGTAAGITTAMIPRALVRLRDLHPRLQIRIEEGRTDSLIHRLRRRELDAAIITKPMLPESDMQILPITSEPLLVVAPKSVRARGWKNVLQDRPFLRLNRLTGIGALIDATLRQSGVAVDDAMDLDNSESIVGLVSAGLGVGVVPAGRLKGIDRTKLRILPFGTPPAHRRVVLMERNNSQRSDVAAILYRELLALTGNAA